MFEITVSQKTPLLKIMNNAGAKSIKFGETLRLTAVVTNKPDNAVIYWYINGAKSGEGEIFEISPSNGEVSP